MPVGPRFSGAYHSSRILWYILAQSTENAGVAVKISAASTFLALERAGWAVKTSIHDIFFLMPDTSNKKSID